MEKAAGTTDAASHEEDDMLPKVYAYAPFVVLRNDDNAVLTPTAKVFAHRPASLLAWIAGPNNANLRWLSVEGFQIAVVLMTVYGATARGNAIWEGWKASQQTELPPRLRPPRFRFAGCRCFAAFGFEPRPFPLDPKAWPTVPPAPCLMPTVTMASLG